MNKLLTLTTIAAMMLMVSCNDQPVANADMAQQRASEDSFTEAQKQIGMPEITKFQQRKLLKQIYELCDREDLVCYAYLQSAMSGELVYIGRCIGYGIPFSAQFTNPEKIVEADKMLGKNWSGLFPSKLPQADPNGLFMPTSSSATWLIMVDPETSEPRPVYFEPTIVVSPFPLTKDK